MTAAHGPALCTRCGRPAACFGSHGARNPTHACPACCGGGECVPVRPPSDGHLVLPAPGELDADLVGLARRFGSPHAGAAARVYLHACQA